MKISVKYTIIAALLLPVNVQAAPVNLYTDRQESFMQPIVAAYEKHSGDTINILFAKKGLLERFKTEGNSSPADVILVKYQLPDFVATGLTKPITDQTLIDNVPANYRDGGNWFTVTKRVRALFVSDNTTIQEYADLAAPQYKGKVCLRSGSHAYNIALFADMIDRWGEAATKTWLQGVKNNLARPPQGKDRTQIQDVLNGKCTVGIANSYYYFNLINRADEETRQRLQKDVRMILPLQPHVNITGMTLAKNAPHPEAALRFMRFLVSAEGQALFTAQNFEFPVRDDVAYPDLLEPYRTQMQHITPIVDNPALRRRASELVEETHFNR